LWCSAQVASKKHKSAIKKIKQYFILHNISHEDII
jgi:hypothetical protein